jgi:hypothetical protein
MTFVTGQVPCISVVRIQSLSHYSICNISFFSLRPSPIPAVSDTSFSPSYCSFLVTCPSFFFLGLAVGGLWGLREGARRPLAVSNTRLRINSVLNSVTRRGTFIGNSAGVMGACAFHLLSAPFPPNSPSSFPQPLCIMQLILLLMLRAESMIPSAVWLLELSLVHFTNQQVIALRLDNPNLYP